eukprot:gene6895-7620_t
MNTSIVVAARAYVLDPALLLLVTFPNNVGLEITFPQIDRRYVSLFCLPALLGNFLGMVYAGGRQVRSMAGSGLLPSFLATVQQDDAIVVNVVREGNKEERTLSESNSEKEQILKEKEPIVAMVICSIISYILLVICYEELDYTHFLLIILRVGGLQASNKKKRRGQSNSRGNSKKSSLRDLWTRISMNIVGLPTANSLQSSLKSRGSDRLNSSVPMLLLGQNKVSPSTDDQHVKQEVRIVP